MGKGLRGGLGQSHAEPEAMATSIGLQPSRDQEPEFPKGNPPEKPSVLLVGQEAARSLA